MAHIAVEDLKLLEQRIGYCFKNKQLINLALTHRSLGQESYERLEFLGDSILGLFVSERLYEDFPESKEGKLSRMRAKVVCGQSLSLISQHLKINEFIQTKSQSSNDRKLPDSLLADMIESITGAIYLDSDIETCRQVVLPWFEDMLTDLDPDDVFKDAKTQLQEWLQANHLPLPEYELEELSNRGGKRLFLVKCMVKCFPRAIEAKGGSRREAEQLAASQTLELIEQLNIQIADSL